MCGHLVSIQFPGLGSDPLPCEAAGWYGGQSWRSPRWALPPTLFFLNPLFLPVALRMGGEVRPTWKQQEGGRSDVRKHFLICQALKPQEKLSLAWSERICREVEGWLGGPRVPDLTPWLLS